MVNSKDLNGKWKLWAFPAQSEKLPPDTTANFGAPMEAEVPGNVEFALQKAGLLPEDLFMGTNILEVQKFEMYDYLYERSFSMTEEELAAKWRFVFEGADCCADYYLNGVKFAESANAMIEHSFPVDGLLREQNTLRVYLRSALAEASQEEYYPYTAHESYNHSHEQQRLRKPASAFGWDIMPRTVSAGLWRGVRIERIPESEIGDLYISTYSASPERAVLIINCNVRTEPKNVKKLALKVEGRCGESSFSELLPMHFTAGTMKIEVKNPKLWMPRDYGVPNLYDTAVTLLVDGEAADEKRLRVGIRTVRLDRTPRDRGFREFRFFVNGTPVFCKGSNWVPLDAFHSRDRLRLKKAIELAADLNCNILRCWGGNVYEDHEFFDLCDENGIMVWQDFGMACGAYPEDEKFMRAMSEEAVSVIRKLRGHASLILWCGDNECDYFAADPKSNKITRELLPHLVKLHDPCRPYLASSPDLGEREDGDMRDTGVSAEQHIWGARDHFKARFYTEHTARFVSETGYHGCNSPESIAKFITPEKLWPWNDNDEWLAHAADDGRGWYAYRIELMAKQIRQTFGEIPDNLADFAFASQFTQAEAKKFFIERMRTRKWETTGIIWWNLTDGWPQFSDAVTDYYFEKKQAYYTIRRSQQSCVLCMGEIENWRAPLTVVNDTLSEKQGGYIVKDAETGKILAEGEFRVPANEKADLPGVELFYSERRMLLLELRFEGKSVMNYRIIGNVPFSLEDAKRWHGILQTLN